MKKILLLLMLIMLLGGCNLFESLDSEDSSTETLEYLNQRDINEGNPEKALERIAEQLEGMDVNSEEYAMLKLLQAEALLGVSGASLTGILQTLIDVNNNDANAPADASSYFSDIVGDDIVLGMAYATGDLDLPEDPEALELALAQQEKYESLVNASAAYEEFSGGAGELSKTDYLNAGMADIMLAANLVIEVFDINGDNKVDQNDKIGTGYVSRRYDQKYPVDIEYVNIMYHKYKYDIEDYLKSGIDNLKSVFGIEDDDVMSEVIGFIEKILDELETKEFLTEEDFDKFVDEIFTALEDENYI